MEHSAARSISVYLVCESFWGSTCIVGPAGIVLATIDTVLIRYELLCYSLMYRI